MLPLTKREKYELLNLLEDLQILYDMYVDPDPDSCNPDLVTKYLDLIWKHLDD